MSLKSKEIIAKFEVGKYYMAYSLSPDQTQNIDYMKVVKLRDPKYIMNVYYRGFCQTRVSKNTISCSSRRFTKVEEITIGEFMVAFQTLINKIRSSMEAEK